jgi:tryptophan-rich sensory protein
MKKALGIIVFVIVCELAGLMGSLFTTPSIPGWYAGLTKPAFNPPSWLFAPVWTILYAVMGIAAWLVYDKGIKSPEAKRALSLFATQLLLNILWSIVFFGAHRILGGVIVIVGLWVMILRTILLFYKISRPAACLLIPYILWVSFATVLNVSLYMLNR